VCDYALGFVFDDWEDAALAGRADDARTTSARLRGLLDSCVALQGARLPRGWTVASLRADDVPAALAIARAQAAQLALAPLAGLLQLPALRTLLARCAALRPGEHDADAELLLGVLDAETSKFTHGDDGRAWFARARRLAGDGALIIDVLEARVLAEARHDAGVLEAAVARVTAAELSRWPERRLANTLAVRKAQRYLAHAAAL
jgi:hypothetical protein